jgi:hypothetical protein
VRVALLRRHAVSISVAVLAVLLGGYLYLVDRDRVTTTESDARKRNLLRAFRRAEITEIVVEDPSDTVRVVRRGDDAGDTMYFLGSGEVADQVAVDKLLGVLEFATAERRLEGDVDRRAMGLDAPRARVTVSMGALTYRLSIGAPAPAPAGAAYAEVAGEGVVVVSRDLVTELTRPHSAYRGKTLVPYLSSSLSELRIEGAGGTRTFTVGPWGGWRVALEGGQKVRVDRDAWDRLLSSLAEVRAEAFTTEAEADRVLAAAPDKIRLTMIPKDGAQPRAILDLGGECPGQADDAVAVRVEPAPKKAACVPKGVLAPLSTALGRLVDRHVFSPRPDEMEAVTLSAQNQRLELARSGTGWHLRAPAEGNVESDVGQAFTRTLSELSAERVVTDKAPESLGFAAPRGTATITKVGAAENAPSETVELGAEAGEFAYARRVTDGAILELTRDAALALVPSSFTLRSRKVVDHPIGQVTRVSIETPSMHQVLHRTSTGFWTLEQPSSLAVDPGLANDVAEALAQLRADRWVADRDDGSFGLDKPRAKYQLELEGGVVRVETGRATSGGAFARRTDREGIFVLPTAAERTLETWAVDRSYFMFEPGDVRQIRIDRAGRRSTLEPVRPGARDAGSAERFEAARRVLSEARAEGLVHVGAPRGDEGFDTPLATVTVQKGNSTIQFSIGRGDAWRDTNVFYARRDGVDATFAIAQSKIRPLLDLSEGNPDNK